MRFPFWPTNSRGRKQRISKWAKRRQSAGHRTLSIEALEGRQMLSVTLGPITNVQAPSGKSVLVPLTGTDSGGGPISYTFQASNNNVQMSLVSPGSQSLKLHVTGTDKNGQAFAGDLILKLFEDLTPNTTARIEELVGQNFYDGLTFHRIVDGFVAQGGSDNVGTGQDQDDEFDSSLTYTSRGLLAMARTNNHDTADDQFFITAIDKANSTTPTALADMFRSSLEFRYTIFGQLVSGFDVFEKMMTTPVQGQGGNPNAEHSEPLNTVTITSADIINDTQDAVLRVSAPANLNGTNVTVTVTATNSANETTQQTFTAAVTADTFVDPPFLGDVTNQTTTVGTPNQFTLTSTDVSAAGVQYKVGIATTNPSTGIVDFGTSPNVTISINQSTGVVTLTPAANFTGTLTLLAGVRATSAADSIGSYDTQQFTLTVGAIVKPTITPVADQTTTIGVPVTVNLAATGGTGTPVFKIVDPTTHAAPTNATITIDANGHATITPKAGFTGTVNLLAEARSSAAADTQDNYSTDPFTLTVNTNTNPNVPVPTALAVDTSSNTGKFDGNGYVTTSTPKLRVTALTGATVNFKMGGVVIATGTETAAGSGIYTATIPAGKLKVGANSITANVTDGDGTSADSTALSVIFAPDYSGGVYVVPTVSSSQPLTVNLIGSRAAFKDEIGYFIADSADGSIGGKSPSSAGYAQAAIGSSTHKVLFHHGQRAGASATIDAQAGQFVVFYMIQNDTTANFLSKNAGNAVNGNPLAFFSITGANPDTKKHTQIIADSTTGRVQYNWEDLLSNGDSDFNDMVMTVQAGTSTKSSATLHAPGTGSTSVTLNGTIHGQKQPTPKGDVGVFFADTPDGNIGTLKPGDSGYVAAALGSSNSKVLASAGAASGSAHSVTVPAGKYIGFYIITNGTTSNLLTTNPSNNAGGGSVALFSFDDANPDHENHFRWFSPGTQHTDPSVVQLHVMDKVSGKEADFDSFTMDVNFS